MSARFLFYSHDSFGLGHLRRTLALARAVTERDREASALILTGSAMASSYRLPPRVDTVKLPAVTKRMDGDYESLRLGVDFDELKRLRASLAFAAVTAFDPSVAVIDKTPLGLRGELEPALDAIKARRLCRVVLGMRDVDDSPSNVRSEWRERSLPEIIRAYYDAVLVYGPLSTLDALDCLGLDDLGVPVHHVGYVGPPMPDRGPPDLPDDYLLVTVGGGGDGLEVLTTFVRAIDRKPLPLSTVIVTGPLMDDADVECLHELTAGLHVRVQEFRPDMEAVIAGARAVVSMAGYNTVAELLHAGKPALLVPRVRPREEQLVRADALARRGVVEMIHPDHLHPETMRAALDALLQNGAPRRDPAIVNGATQAAAILHDLAAAAPPRAPTRRFSDRPRARAAPR